MFIHPCRKQEIIRKKHYYTSAVTYISRAAIHTAQELLSSAALGDQRIHTYNYYYDTEPAEQRGTTRYRGLGSRAQRRRKLLLRANAHLRWCSNSSLPRRGNVRARFPDTKPPRNAAQRQTCTFIEVNDGRCDYNRNDHHQRQPVLSKVYDVVSTKSEIDVSQAAVAAAVSKRFIKVRGGRRRTCSCTSYETFPIVPNGNGRK
uniref:Uncharacterized protein n=1 Tax=Trichogramma kaykai TaxID=54128 RepID=A0ABD2XH14_9HYME